MSITFIASFPFPPAELNPNKRVHYQMKARIGKSYAAACGAITRQWCQANNASVFHGKKRLHLWLTFHPPNKQKRDDDNLVAAFKLGRDALAKALGFDDCILVTHAQTVAGEKPKPSNAAVHVMISEELLNPVAMDVFGP